MKDEERDALTEVGINLLREAVKEMDRQKIPKSGQFAFLLNVATHIALEEMGMDIERLTAITLRCFSQLVPTGTPEKP
jgi:hypothetical protein